MSITVASILNAQGKRLAPTKWRSEVAAMLGLSKQTVNGWVTRGVIPAKYVWMLSDPEIPGANIFNPEFRALFDLAEPLN